MSRERSIYKTLKALSKQRVGMVIQPENHWVIEYAMPHTPQNEENIQTCLMRGWVEILHQSVPTEHIPVDFNLQNIEDLGENHVYRLTDGGWNAIYRTRSLNLLSIFIALIGLGIAVLALQP
ncbi:MAG: hypothetical protein Q7W55_13545 [Pseudohongiella sp.]|nr:hypothetical protein [Pseudohongiella sp.]